MKITRTAKAKMSSSADMMCKYPSSYTMHHATFDQLS